jgi:L-fucose isomerase-like protein
MLKNKPPEFVEGIGKDEILIIREGFTNHILWNLGHFYVVQEQLTFQLPRESYV